MEQAADPVPLIRTGYNQIRPRPVHDVEQGVDDAVPGLLDQRREFSCFPKNPSGLSPQTRFKGEEGFRSGRDRPVPGGRRSGVDVGESENTGAGVSQFFHPLQHRERGLPGIDRTQHPEFFP